MLSRVVEAIYWAGRYMERAENTARFVDVNLRMGLDAPIAFSDQWEPLVSITGDRDAYLARHDAFSREDVIRFLASEPQNPSSIYSCLQKARENARSIREIISSETWEQLNRFYLTVANGAAKERPILDSYQFFAEVKLHSHIVAGVADNTMSHNQAWHFFQLGRLLERCDNTSRLLDVKYFLLLPPDADVGGAVDEMQWSILLRSASALEMYRKRFGRIAPDLVVDFLLLEQEFPRAVLFCLIKAGESLQAITGSQPGRFHNLAEQRLGRLRSDLAYAHVYDIIESGLHEFLDGLQAKLNGIGDAIAQTFFIAGTQAEPSNVARGRSGRDVLSGGQGERGPGGNRRNAQNLGQ